MVTKTFECGFTDALLSRLALFAMLVLVFGTPMTIIGALLGYMIEKIRIS
jgi:hypothetical protein